MKTINSLCRSMLTTVMVTLAAFPAFTRAAEFRTITLVGWEIVRIPPGGIIEIVGGGASVRGVRTDPETGALGELVVIGDVDRGDILASYSAFSFSQSYRGKSFVTIRILTAAEANASPEPDMDLVVEGSEDGKDWKVLATYGVRMVEIPRRLFRARLVAREPGISPAAPASAN